MWPDLVDPRRDMTGLNLSYVYLRSRDGGATWTKVSQYAFRSPVNTLAVTEAALRDGTILRALFGSYLPYDADVPGTGLVQRSTDGTKTWGRLTSLLSPDTFTVYPKGIRQLRDGRVALLGGVSRVPAGRTWLEYYKVMDPLLLVSDDNGKTWGPPIQVIPEKNRKGWACEECDAAELPNGDLFWVFRRSVPEDADKPLNKRGHTYWQGVTEKHGDTWTPKWVGPSPFPNLGLPSLVATRQGVILLCQRRPMDGRRGKDVASGQEHARQGLLSQGHSACRRAYPRVRPRRQRRSLWRGGSVDYNGQPQIEGEVRCPSCFPFLNGVVGNGSIAIATRMTSVNSGWRHIQQTMEE